MDAIAQQIVTIAKEAGYPPGLLLAQAWQESTFNPQAKSPTGAAGLFQFMPATAAQYQVDVNDVTSSIKGAITYMQALFYRYAGNKAKALAAYNWGMGNLDSLLRKHPDDWQAFLPAETKGYLRILDMAAFAEHLI